jgi:TRAP-type mannitol/chloroaromatic compound transport system permease small subunit
MKKIVRAIDRLNDRVGMGVRWLSILALGIICGEVFMRYVLNHPTTVLQITAVMTAATMYSCSFGYVHLHRRHIRVDVIYTHFPSWLKLTIDVFCALLFLLPLIGLLAYAGWNWMWFAWETKEVNLFSWWYPIMGPVRTAVFIGFVLFALQGIATLYRDIYFLVRHEEL